MSSIRSNKSSLLTDIAAKFPLRRLRRSRKDSNNSAISSSHIPYEVHRNTMVPAILTDHSATNKLLEAILESPNGRRSLSRLARTCKAFSEPALNVLWRELDSLVPIIGLFPAKLLRKSRKPGLGLVGGLNTYVRFSNAFFLGKDASRRRLEESSYLRGTCAPHHLYGTLQQCFCLHFHYLRANSTSYLYSSPFTRAFMEGRGRNLLIMPSNCH